MVVCRRHPAVAVYVVVVRACVAAAVRDARVGVVGRDVPRQRRPVHTRAEAQVLCRVVDLCPAVEPDALQVDGHVNLVTRVGIVSEDPQLVVRRVHAFHPHLVQEYVCRDLILVSAVNHQLVLAVQVAHRAQRLAVREVVCRPG